MNDARKLAFVAHQTALALNHAARVPNTMAPDGKMSHDKMLAFISQVTKHGLQHFDSGGAVKPIAVGGGQISGPSAPASTQSTVVGQPSNATSNPNLTDFSGVGDMGRGNTGNGQPGIQSGIVQASGNTPLSGTVGNITQNAVGGVGSFMQGVGQAFTTQNQFQAQGAPIQQGTNAGQLNAAYNGVQGGLQQQQGLADTLTPGVGQAAGAQYNLSNQLQQQAQGLGPNPAQNQFKQNTQALAGQQAGAIASMKGISPALQARLIAQQGSSAQQNAAGAEATLAAQQQIAAQNNLQNLSANQVAQGATAVQGVNNTQQNEQNILQNANSAFNNAQVAQQSSLNNINANVAQNNANAVNKSTSGLLGGASSVLGALFAGGGMVGAPHGYADGGVVPTPTASPQSYVGQWLSSVSNATGPSIDSAPIVGSGDAGFSGLSKSSGGGGAPAGAGGMGGGGAVENAGQGPTQASADSGGGIPYAGTNYGSALMNFGAGAKAYGGLMSSGGKVNAPNSKEKATAKGNSYANDKIPAMLSEGEIVIPREITMSDRAPEKAAMFVAKILAHKGMVKR